MMQNEKYQNKYRIPSNRLQGWNYGWNGTYFITICTHNRMCYFGDIHQNEMHATELGRQAEKCAVEIQQHFPFVIMDGFVIMPNHVHLLFTICKTGIEMDTHRETVLHMDAFTPMDVGTQMVNVETKMVDFETYMAHCVETQNFASLQPPQPPHKNPDSENTFGPQSKNVASIVRGFKIGVTKYARNHGIDFAWQTRYYDHIVRNEQAYNRILFYIQNNINQWNKDSLKP